MSFRLRLFLAMAIVLAANAAVVVLVTIVQARRAFTREGDAQLELALSTAVHTVTEWGDELVAGADALAERPDVASVFERLRTGRLATDDPDVVALARRLHTTPFDALYILDTDGTVLSAFPNTAAFGTPRPELAAAASVAGTAAFPVTDGGESSLAAAAVMDGRRIVGLRRFTAGDVAQLSSRIGTDITIRWGALALSSGAAVAPARATKTGTFSDGRGTITVSRSRDPLAELRGNLIRTVPFVVGLSWLALWPLAFWIARRLGRPVEALTRATERVAAGDWERPVDTPGDSREFRALIASFNDMQRDLVRQQRELSRAERAGAWRDAARRTAHEINNALTPIQLAWERIRSGTPGVEDTTPHAESVESELASLRQLVVAFRDLAEWPAPQRAPVDVADLARNVVALYEPTTDATVRVEGPETVWVDVDAGQISRAVANLLQNAIDAVGSAGTVTLRVAEAENAVTIEVSDDGPGLNDEEQRDVFVPYHTTKATGTGLGLAIVERIADAHGGSAAFDSAPGRGTRVTFTLPRAASDG